MESLIKLLMELIIYGTIPGLIVFSIILNYSENSR